MVLSSIMLGACTNDEDSKNGPGSIYGIVTELGTAEPMKAVGVELYKAGDLLLKTVTFDDGHFEFSDLNSGSYRVKVVADGYEQTEEGNVTVEAGRQARIDLQVKESEIGLVMKTIGATVNKEIVTLNGELTYTIPYILNVTNPNEIGFLYATHDNPKDGGIIVKCMSDNILKENRGDYRKETFTATVNDLDEGTYYFQAYAINSKGTAYGEVRSFTIQHPDHITFSNLMIQTRDLGRFRLQEAKELCASSRVGGYSDWRLPTVAELSMIYQFKDEIGGFKKNSYWSSTDIADRYYYVDFSSGSQYSSYSTEYRYVRAVRTIK